VTTRKARNIHIRIKSVPVTEAFPSISYMACADESQRSDVEASGGLEMHGAVLQLVTHLSHISITEAPVTSTRYPPPRSHPPGVGELEPHPHIPFHFIDAGCTVKVSPKATKVLTRFANFDVVLYLMRYKRLRS
jgi:hypothetical protein